MAIILCCVLGFTLCGCNGSKYKTATEYLNNKEFNQALVLFEELAAAGYEDSAKMVKEVKYQYSKANLNNDDTTTYQYLKELSKDGYLDSNAIYKDLYSRKVKIAINTRQQSSVHYDELNVTNKTFPIYFFNFRTYGGVPNDEYRGKYEVVFSNGQKVSDTFIGKNNDFYFAITLSGTQNPCGKTTFNVYDNEGNLLATQTSVIK